MTFYMKQNDTAPPLQVQLLEDDNVTPISLTTAVSVVFNMRTRPGGVVLVNRGVCTIVNAATGIVEYPWSTGDTATNSGATVELAHAAEFEVVFSNGKVRTVPSDSYINVLVTDDIA